MSHISTNYASKNGNCSTYWSNKPIAKRYLEFRFLLFPFHCKIMWMTGSLLKRYITATRWQSYRQDVEGQRRFFRLLRSYRGVRICVSTHREHREGLCPPVDATVPLEFFPITALVDRQRKFDCQCYYWQFRVLFGDATDTTSSYRLYVQSSRFRF